MTSDDNRWCGPLFLIGMPRSGTKLLRSLLNQHPMIAIPESETEFFPFWVRNWGQFGDLSQLENFKSFVDSQKAFPYFIYTERVGTHIDVVRWHERCRSYDPAEVFRQLVHEDTRTAPGTRIWGDKSPSYTTQIPLLTEQFPTARFVHIVRDARDYCLSISKAWHKNISRAAVRWRDALAALRLQAEPLGPERITHLHYEDLLSDPEQELRSLCDFIGVEFDEQMLQLARPSENIGDAKGQQRIVAGNTGKFREQLSAETVRRIESLCGEELAHWGYQVDVRGAARIPGWQMLAYRLADGVNLLRADAGEHGLLGAFKLHYSAYRMSLARRVS